MLDVARRPARAVLGGVRGRGGVAGAAAFSMKIVSPEQVILLSPWMTTTLPV